MAEAETSGLKPISANGAQLKQAIAAEKIGKKKTEAFDPDASMLGTDNEAGALPDPDGLTQAWAAANP